MHTRIILQGYTTCHRSCRCYTTVHLCNICKCTQWRRLALGRCKRRTRRASSCSRCSSCSSCRPPSCSCRASCASTTAARPPTARPNSALRPPPSLCTSTTTNCIYPYLTTYNSSPDEKDHTDSRIPEGSSKAETTSV